MLIVPILWKIRKNREDFPFFVRYTRYKTVPLFLFFVMSAIDSLFSTPTASTSVPAHSDRLNELTMSDFIKMMVAQLENQDPMDPMSNTEMLQQMSQMRAITANDRLTDSIESLTLGQALSTASSLIGKTVTGVNTLDQTITGKVDKVTIENGEAKLYVGSSIISVKNVTAIVDTPAESI